NHHPDPQAPPEDVQLTRRCRETLRKEIDSLLPPRAHPPLGSKNAAQSHCHQNQSAPDSNKHKESISLRFPPRAMDLVFFAETLSLLAPARCPFQSYLQFLQARQSLLPRLPRMP